MYYFKRSREELDVEEHYSTEASIEPKSKKLSTIPNTSSKFIHLEKYESWTKEQVCSLLCTEKNNGGAGISINNALQDTIEQIVDWIDKRNKISNAQITPDELKSARNDDIYDYLRNLNYPQKMDNLETMIGSNIQLPILGLFGTQYVPKDFNPTTPYLLTRQRFEILKKVINTRSEECFLVIPLLLYVPKCGIWVDNFVDGGKIGADNYLRSMIFRWNSDILSPVQILQLYDANNVVSTFSSIFSIDKIIYYLFDEHNELFRPDINGIMSIQESYFHPYSRWSRVTIGSQCSTMTIYCGSAHSKFEDYLPGGSISKIIRIIPPTSSEFQKLVEMLDLN